MPETTTQTLLRRYHRDFGHRPVIEQWRKNVPAAARKAWLKSFIEEAGLHKMLNIQFREQVISTLQPEDQAAFQERCDTINNLFEDTSEDTTLVAHFQLPGLVEEIETWLRVHATTQTLEWFAKNYFSEFDEEPNRIKSFFEQQDHLVSQLQPIVLAATDGTIFSQLHDLTDEALPGTAIGTALYTYHKSHRSRRESVQPVKQSTISPWAGMVVCGSSAIGPRSADYAKPQDVDLLLLPNINHPDPQYLQQAKVAIDVMRQVLIEMLDGTSHQKRIGLLTKIKKTAPGWYEPLKALIGNGRQPLPLFDLHVADPLYPRKRHTEDWIKLVGPHRIVETALPLNKTIYQQYLDAGITTALDSTT